MQPAAPLAVYADPGTPGGPASPSGQGKGTPPSPFKGLGAAYLMLASVLIGFGLGYWLDHRHGTMPWWTIGLTVLFLIAGFYHLVREAQK